MLFGLGLMKREGRGERDSAIRDRTGDSSTRMYVALATKPRRLRIRVRVRVRVMDLEGRRRGRS